MDNLVVDANPHILRTMIAARMAWARTRSAQLHRRFGGGFGAKINIYG